MKYKMMNIDRKDYYKLSSLVEYWNDLSKRLGNSAYLISSELDKFGKTVPMTKMVYTLEVIDLDVVSGIVDGLGNWELVKVKDKKRRK